MPAFPPGFTLEKIQEPKRAAATKPGREIQNANLRPGLGRGKGRPNKIHHDVRLALTQAAIDVGDGNQTGLLAYFTDLALHHKKLFCMLLARTIPAQPASNIEPDNPVTVAVNIVGIPSGCYIQRDSDGNHLPMTLENEPQRVAAESPIEKQSAPPLVEDLAPPLQLHDRADPAQPANLATPAEYAQPARPDATRPRRPLRPTKPTWG